MDTFYASCINKISWGEMNKSLEKVKTAQLKPRKKTLNWGHSTAIQ